jgi:hypothetical protein
MPVSFIASLSQVIKQGTPAILCGNGNNCISVYPSHDYYIDNTNDWEAVFSASEISMQEAPATEMNRPEGALSLTVLQWRAAYHEALRKPMASAPLGELLQLASWPNVTRLPEEHVVTVTRICALLWRKPTVGFLVPRILDAPPLQVNALLKLLLDLRHVVAPRADLPVRHAAEHERSMDEPVMPTEEAPTRQTGSLVSKLWQRLTGH